MRCLDYPIKQEDMNFRRDEFGLIKKITAYSNTALVRKSYKHDG